MPSAPLSRSPSPNPTAPAPHPPKVSHPPPLYYLPAVLTPSQSSFLERRKKQIASRIDEERSEWEEQRKKGLDGVREMKQRAAEAALELKAQKEREKEAMIPEDGATTPQRPPTNGDGDPKDIVPEEKEAEEPPAAPMDTDDDALEY